MGGVGGISPFKAFRRVQKGISRNLLLYDWAKITKYTKQHDDLTGFCPQFRIYSPGLHCRPTMTSVLHRAPW